MRFVLSVGIGQRLGSLGGEREGLGGKEGERERERCRHRAVCHSID